MLFYLHAWTRLQTDSHQCPLVGRVTLPDRPMLHTLLLQLLLEFEQSLDVGLEDDSVGAGAQVTCRRLACCVCDLSSEETSWEVGSDNDVVGDGIGPRGLTVNRSSSLSG